MPLASSSSYFLPKMSGALFSFANISFSSNPFGIFLSFCDTKNTMKRKTKKLFLIHAWKRVNALFLLKSQTLYRLYYVVKKLLLICVWKKYGKILLEVIVKISTYKILFRHPDEMSEDELSSPLYTGINPPRLLWCRWYGGGWWSVTATASSLMTVASDVAL